MGRTIAIGDIHGCSEALRTLLKTIRPQGDDTIVCLGDYIDRGPNSRDVIEQIFQLRQQCELITLLGNHELMLLLAKDDAEQLGWWETCGGAATLLSYDDTIESIPESHFKFFEACPLAYETDTHIFVHANYEASIPMDEQNDQVMLWHHLDAGQIPARHISGKQVIVGHTPQVDGDVLDLGHLICIDTYCFGNGWLTALDVDSGEIWQANQAGELRADNEQKVEEVNPPGDRNA